jgi:hypothetical protein
VARAYVPRLGRSVRVVVPVVDPAPGHEAG